MSPNPLLHQGKNRRRHLLASVPLQMKREIKLVEFEKQPSDK